MLNQLEEHLKKINKIVVRNIKVKITDMLKKHIMDDVYMFDYFPNKQYQPTWDFYNSFKWQEIDEFTNIMSYDWQSLRAPSTEHLNAHGSFDKGIDRRKALAAILNVTGHDSDNDFGGKERNEYWNNFLNDLDKNIKIWLDEEYSRLLR